MRITKETPSTEPKRKALTIHIDTDHVGPHGMPLVYGSTPDKIGSIKGTVRFESNYDCRGRNIVILYEAKAEAQWTALENKKVVNHHTEEIFGHQTWHFPLDHTKANGLTVVAGKYEKEFEVPLIHPSALNRSSTLPSSGHSTSTTNGSNALLPSSSYSPNAKMKYTIRAILQRPFPCITDIEASQEVWVLQSCLPPPAKPKSPLQPPRSLLLNEADHNQADPAITVTAPIPPATTDSTAPSTEGQDTTALTMPSKVIKSALSMLPTIDLSRSKQLLPLSFPSLPTPLSPRIPPPPPPQESPASEKSQQEDQSPTDATASTKQPTSSKSRSRPSSPDSAPPSRSSSGTTKNSVESEDWRWSDDEDPANYTGLWEPFQVPYSCSLPSETVYVGQKVPLTIRFGPRKGDRRRRRDAAGVYNKGDRKKHRRPEHKHDEDDDNYAHARENSPPGGVPRFVVKKGVLKLVEHSLLREVTVMPAPSKLRNRKQAIPIASANNNNNNHNNNNQDIPFDRRARKQVSEQSPSPGLNAHGGIIDGNVSTPPSSISKKRSKALIYQEKSYNGSHSHLYDLLHQESKNHQDQSKTPSSTAAGAQLDRRRSTDLKRLFFKPKRHSMDFSTERSSTPIRDLPLTASPPMSPTVPTAHGLPPPPVSTRIISTIESKFKTEVMNMPLTTLIQQREARYQRRLRRKLRRAHGDGAGTLTGEHGAIDGEEKEGGGDGDDEDDETENEDERERQEEEDGARNEDEGVWQTTVWIQLPGPAELATCTETKHIVKKHTLQLILLCGLVGGHLSPSGSFTTDSAAGGGGGHGPAGTIVGGTLSDKVITQPGVNKEFRLEMDLHVTGPRVPA